MGGKIIGLTGAYCAGKNYIAGLLERRGLAVLDVDKLGHQAITGEKPAIVARFGNDILGPDGEVDRRILGAKVFGRPGELAALEALVHPAANRLTLRWLKEQRGRPCVVNAALLHKSSVFKRLDAVILVKAPLITRLLRAKKRDGLPWTALIRRFQSQRGFAARYAPHTRYAEHTGYGGRTGYARWTGYARRIRHVSRVSRARRDGHTGYGDKNFLGHADMYVIDNRGCPVFASRLVPGWLKRWLERRLERRIDEILAREGIL